MTNANAQPGADLRLRLRVGVDLVSVPRIAESMDRFGDRFLRRIFTVDEIAYALAAPSQTAERLAARFAAKEATLKALSLVDEGVDWRNIELRRADRGACAIALHGAVADAARALYVHDLSVSISHEGDHAIAFVVAQAQEPPA
jgi:holo-[acyl-carrier protein] synthase